MLYFGMAKKGIVRNIKGNAESLNVKLLKKGEKSIVKRIRTSESVAKWLEPLSSEDIGAILEKAYLER